MVETQNTDDASQAHGSNMRHMAGVQGRRWASGCLANS